jgi:hypothetical protein
MKRQERGFLNHETDDEEQLAVALEQCEAALYGGLRQQLEASAFVGAQLVRIRENQLFRAAGCETFEMYCRKFLELNRDRVRRYLDVHEVVETIRTAGMELPVGETQAVMCAKIPRSRLIACWRTVIEVCLEREMALSDAVVRRAMRLEIASKQLASPSESIAEERTKKSHGAGVKVTLDFEA